MMGGLSIWHWLVVGVIILLLFGKGRFSEMMGDVAKGLKSFKKGMSEDEEAAATVRAEEQRRIRDDRLAAAPERPRDPDPLRKSEPLHDPELDRREP
jgi:sec-independent protein translocase protein TatA